VRFALKRDRKGTCSVHISPQIFDSLPVSASPKRTGFGKTHSLRPRKCQIIVGRNVPAAHGQTATSWPRTRAQWRCWWPNGRVPDLAPRGAPWGTRQAFRSGRPAPLCPKGHSNSRHTHGKVVWTRESSHANLCTHFPLRADGDYHPRRRRCPIFIFLGLPAAAALDVDRDGPATDSKLALARVATAAMRLSR
jgi:hypothetical protein